ncbi:endo-beta-N-acetylglucosaminidase H [Microbacterium sp. NPDC089987]|uniref:endo-beta-N-acetylglucosaminidase H n=1 Tax=Microbacterium sp. NPDC089987 TaxID=3364202 RepID=UPI003814AD66
MNRSPSPRRRRAGLAAVAALGLAVAGLTVPAAASGAATGAADETDDPKRVVYVEVNNEEFANVADYTLEGTNRPAFDVAMIFAANINYDVEKQQAYLHFNDQVTATLEQAETQIRPVQERGTKVLLSVLGNHQGAGFANFTSRESAGAFADQLADAVEQYGLDGIDFDDEWSGYGNNDTAQPNATSFAYLLDELRDRLGPDKLITLYNIGPSYDVTDWEGTGASQYLDYSWNPYYGAWNPPQLAGLAKDQLGAAAVDLTQTSLDRATQLAQRTVDEGYGVYVTYNLTAADHSAYLSPITEVLTGRATAYQAPWYDVAVDVQATCAGGKVKLKVRIDSEDDAVLSAKVLSSIGTRVFDRVRDGATRVMVQHAERGTSVDGSLTVSVTGPDGTLDLVQQYAVPACR